jgi:hypothetical protein
MWRAAMRADHLGADLRRLEESLLGALPEFRAERARVGRSRIEMSNRLLQLGNNLGNRPNGLFGQVTVHIIPKADLDTAVPEPANSYVEFAVVEPYLQSLVAEVRAGRRAGHFSRGALPLPVLQRQ